VALTAESELQKQLYPILLLQWKEGNRPDYYGLGDLDLKSRSLSQ